MPTVPDKRRFLVALLFAPLVALFVLYARATYWHCDDAYISFRYVWHLLHGDGLVFNAGERVEGYTNFLWTLELAAIWKWIGVPPERACDALGILCTIGSLVGVLLLARGGPVPERRTFAAFGALLLLATSRTWAVWTTSGLETRQFTLLVVLGVLLVASARGRLARLACASALFAAAEFTRPEGLLLWVCAAAWLALEMYLERRVSWRAAAAFVLPFVVLVGAHFLWRHAYYGDWLPNTYYAKHIRPWPEAGVRYFAAVGIETGAWLLVPIALVGLVARARRGDRTHLLSLLIVGAHVAYLLDIGGDHFEWRPLDFYWPLIAVAAAEGMLATAAGVGRFARARAWTFGPGRETICAGALLAIAVVYGDAIQVAKAQFTLRRETREASRHLRVRLDAGTSGWLLALPGMPLLVHFYDAAQAYTLAHGVGTVWREHEVFWREEQARWSPYESLRGRAALPADTVMAANSIGVLGYYLADTTLVDQRGLTDRYVAHQPVTKPNHERYMAHDRAATPEYLASRGVNVLPAEIVRGVHDIRDARSALRVGPYALGLPGGLWLPFETAHPEWVERALAGREVWKQRVERELGPLAVGADPGWRIEGDAFRAGVRADLPPYTTMVGWPVYSGSLAGWCSREESGHGTTTGSARSAYFAPPPEALLHVHMAGTMHAAVGARVVDREGRVLEEIRAPEDKALAPEHFDLGPFAGREIAFEVFDESDSAWVAVTDVVVLVAERLELR